MEAKALYDFVASRDDELSFRRDDTLKVLNMEDKDWYEAEFRGQRGLIPSTYVEMVPHTWYMAKTSRVEAEAHLSKRDQFGRFVYNDGYFILRDSESDRNAFSLSVKSGSSPQHFKIMSERGANGIEYYLWPDSKFTSINQLINHHRAVSVSKKDNIILKDEQEVAAALPQKPSKPGKEPLYRALYSFPAASPEEVSFEKGDKIQLIEKTDDNWWTGKNLRTNQQGLFPLNYVKEI